jgi:hypothetical protein
MVNVNIQTAINMHNYTSKRVIMITKRKQTNNYLQQFLTHGDKKKAKVLPLPVFAAPRISKP